MIRNPLKLQTFNDGLVAIYATVSPRTIATTPKKILRYHERTVGMNRLVANAQVNVQIDALLRCPRTLDVSAQDIAIPKDGKQYRIKLVQYPEDIRPPVMDLTLEEVQSNYEHAETGE